jgi:hypothetical protein
MALIKAVRQLLAISLALMSGMGLKFDTRHGLEVGGR